MTRTRTLLAVAAALVMLAPGSVQASAPMLPQEGDADVPAVTAPTVLEVFSDERYACFEGARTRTVNVPDGRWNRVVLVFSSTPDGDPWDRLFGVAIGGVEVLRGTTPRTEFTIRKDITEFAALLPPGGTADVSVYMGSWIQAILASVRIEFYADEPTAALVGAPADVRRAFSFRWLGGDGARIAAPVAFPDEQPRDAVVQLTLSGHGAGGEFWYLDDPVPRAFRVLVDGTEVAVARSLPFVYALVGLGQSVSCGEGSNSSRNQVWWTAHQALDMAGVHTGVGEVPPYRATLSGDALSLLRGARTVEVVQEGGAGNWFTSLSFLLR